MQFLRAQDPPCPWDEGALRTAVENGSEEIVGWLRDSGAPEPDWDDMSDDGFTIPMRKWTATSIML
jgi:hypothetical protein